MEDEIAAIQTVTYNAQEICDQLADFVRSFPVLTDGERKLVVDSLIRAVCLKHREVVVVLAPPLSGFGFLSTELAPKEEKPKAPELIIYLAYNLAAHYGTGFPSQAEAYSMFTNRKSLLAEGNICLPFADMA